MLRVSTWTMNWKFAFKPCVRIVKLITPQSLYFLLGIWFTFKISIHQSKLSLRVNTRLKKNFFIDIQSLISIFGSCLSFSFLLCFLCAFELGCAVKDQLMNFWFEGGVYCQGRKTHKDKITSFFSKKVSPCLQSSCFFHSVNLSLIPVVETQFT